MHVLLVGNLFSSLAFTFWMHGNGHNDLNPSRGFRLQLVMNFNNFRCSSMLSCVER